MKRILKKNVDQEVSLSSIITNVKGTHYTYMSSNSQCITIKKEQWSDWLHDRWENKPVGPVLLLFIQGLSLNHFNHYVSGSHLAVS